MSEWEKTVSIGGNLMWGQGEGILLGQQSNGDRDGDCHWNVEDLGMSPVQGHPQS